MKPDVLITSPYVRAAQTAEIFAETLGFSPQKIRAHEALKPAGNPADIVKEVIRLRAKEVMCFGHAPQLDLMIAHVTGAHGVFTALKKAGVACLEHTAGAWQVGTALDSDAENAASTGGLKPLRVRESPKIARYECPGNPRAKPARAIPLPVTI